MNVFQMMDAESGELFLGGSMAADSWQLEAPLSCSDLVFCGSEKPVQDWPLDAGCVSVRAVCGTGEVT